MNGFTSCSTVLRASSHFLYSAIRSNKAILPAVFHDEITQTHHVQQRFTIGSRFLKTKSTASAATTKKKTANKKAANKKHYVKKTLKN